MLLSLLTSYQSGAASRAGFDAPAMHHFNQAIQGFFR
jgi:hypothetical protein